MRIFNWISGFVKGYQVPETFELLATDFEGNTHSLVGLCSSLAKEVLALEKRIKKLEEENISTSNCLYEVENRLQAQIDNIHPVVYNIKNDNWDQ